MVFHGDLGTIDQLNREKPGELYAAYDRAIYASPELRTAKKK